MGIYLFNRETLVEVLTKTDYQDFGKEIFPASIRTRHVQMHLFDGYWEDIGTIRSFYEANLAIAAPDTPFELASADTPIYSRARFLPPARLDGAKITRSLIADGCEIASDCVIENSVIGLRCRIESGVTIRNSVVMGADYYQTSEDIATDRAAGRPPVGIGHGSRIEGVIVDKNVRIGRNVRLVNEGQCQEGQETAQAVICDGLAVVPKDSTVPDGWSL
jgi:glucose-1-phosphate adenylyltransferase